ncbi:MarR family transcriptional regulator [uncultured Acidaminococcus sp.]|uniref:MarR family winged helix-turn-helix transcriptional regulator n=1 Tax=uncultured Acidaminococcus sp. TaxID=352152 RepID=UPI00260E64DB|nr:MarR family transcriptional regulator [uncultured Acidaminococcus sp.]
MTDKQNNVSSLFQDLDEKVDAIFRYNMLMAIYASIPRDYGTGNYVNEIEAHTIRFIHHKPGITAKEICQLTYRTKGTISTLLSHLEQKGYILQKINPDNKRERNLFLTEAGEALNEKHSYFDRKTTMEYLLKAAEHCSPEEIDGYFKMTRFRSDYFEKVIGKKIKKYKENQQK